jgi:ankyrin repeat protein
MCIKCEAFAHHKKLADEGSSFDQVEIATMYFYGNGCDLNLDESFKYYKYALDNNDINALNRLHYLLIFVCKYNHINILKKLIDIKINLNYQYLNGTTGLMIASEYGCLEIVKLLLDKNVDIYLKNQHNETALDLAGRSAENKKDVRLHIINEFAKKGLVSCNNCNKNNTDLSDSLCACNKCLTVLYCNIECQSNDWKNHKKVCKVFN